MTTISYHNKEIDILKSFKNRLPEKYRNPRAQKKEATP